MNIQERWDALSAADQTSIKTLHKVAQSLVDAIDSLAEIKETASTPYDIKTVDGFISNVSQQLTDVEFRLQKLWGFDQDANKHTWWMKPNYCSCPKLDNTDPAFFGGGKIINSECPIHNLTKEQ